MMPANPGLEAKPQPKSTSTSCSATRLLGAFLAIAALQAPPASLAQSGQGSPGKKAASAAPEPKASVATGDAPLTVVHGSSAQIVAEKGRYIHRWVGEDGEPFAIANGQQKEPNLEERRSIEKEFGERIRQLGLARQDEADAMAKYAKELAAANRAIRTYQAQMSNSDK